MKISIFPKVKMAAKYAKIYRIGGLDVDFQQVLLVQTYEILAILLRNINNLNKWRKAKKKKKKKKNVFDIFFPKSSLLKKLHR